MEIKETMKEIHQIAIDHGFWEKELNVGEKLMLVTSELGEALEAHRKGNFADRERFEADSQYNPEVVCFPASIKDTVEDEIADAVIRLFDLAEKMKIDLEWHIRKKMNYNKTREKLHGKAY